jgi:Domain of unknown function (DUF5063)
MSLAIEAFAENVRQFCHWVESDKHDIQTARHLLLALMQGIPCLTVSDDDDENDGKYPRRDHDQWKADHKRLADFPLQYYREVFAPCERNEAPPVTGDAHDDLADIYGDLWHGLLALDRGDGNYAFQYWRESYFIHWGHHASALIYAVDEYYRTVVGDEPDVASTK